MEHVPLLWILLTLCCKKLEFGKVVDKTRIIGYCIDPRGFVVLEAAKRGWPRKGKNTHAGIVREECGDKAKSSDGRIPA